MAQSTKFDVQVAEDADALSRTAAAAIIGQITETLQEKEFFAIALSGGSTPRLLFSLLANDASF
mgnify:CR=1 FL=1